ncbi:hypothetical protein [Sandaracinus amylolyticus]|uniref:Lipoprotein n=1 Tax=Sandaracinus amylolyticus TaxID=927083 RepID=A0A0F6W3W4_9BACT|nr:hypothetical protein [Sandaracinus amylolyticus]AKF06825.1 hypothetical protein DB32_003974 [Sandaracinus amylolyticus]
MLTRVPVVAAVLALVLPGCCVNPFVGTDTHVAPDAPGSPERETRGSLEEHAPAPDPRDGDQDGPGAGFDIRLVRVQPGIHLGTEQLCDVAAAGRLEPIELDEQGESPEQYSTGATQRMSVQCIAPTGASWADLAFTPTNVSHAPEVQPGARVRVRIHSADSGFFDYPIVDFVGIAGRAPERTIEGGRMLGPTAVPTGFDLRQIGGDPALVGSTQQCAVSHAGDIDILEARDARRRSYPAGIQNRMTIKCRHAGGEEWADLVFMPAQARAALHVGRGDVIPVTVVSRSGGFSDYPVLQFAGE